MENSTTNINPQYSQFNNQVSIPNSVSVLVLGICSIVFCWCAGFVGLVLGIIALVLYNKANKLHKLQPGAYTEASLNNLNAGRVCAIIGTSLSGIYFICWIIYVVIMGAIVSLMPWKQMMGNYN